MTTNVSSNCGCIPQRVQLSIGLMIPTPTTTIGIGLPLESQPNGHGTSWDMKAPSLRRQHAGYLVEQLLTGDRVTWLSGEAREVQ